MTTRRVITSDADSWEEPAAPADESSPQEPSKPPESPAAPPPGERESTPTDSPSGGFSLQDALALGQLLDKGILHLKDPAIPVALAAWRSVLKGGGGSQEKPTTIYAQEGQLKQAVFDTELAMVELEKMLDTTLMPTVGSLPLKDVRAMLGSNRQKVKEELGKALQRCITYQEAPTNGDQSNTGDEGLSHSGDKGIGQDESREAHLEPASPGGA